MYEGFLEFGDTEIINSARTAAYVAGSTCGVSWIQCPPCDGLADALGETEEYTLETIADAPWYDPDIEATHRFYGVHGLTFEGLPGSTRTANVQEGILDGGVVGQVRNGTRRVRVEAMLSANGEDALEAGLAWLDAALRPERCSEHHNHSSGCGPHSDVRIFTACPPAAEEVTKLATAWNSEITNLATNPSFETAGTVVAVDTNLATNPSFEAITAATVEVRRNRATDPRATALPSGAATAGYRNSRWFGGGGGAGTYAFLTGQTGPVSGLTTIARKTWTVAATTNGDSGFDHSTGGVNGIPVLAGEVFTASSYLRTSAASKTANPWFAFFDSAGATVAPGRINGANVSLTANVWTRLSQTITVPATAAFMIFCTDINATGTPWAVGNTLDGTGLLIEKNPSLASYFDGATAPAGDFVYSWTGTANASASVSTGLQVPGTTSSSSVASILSSDWALGGVKSLRMIPRVAANDSGSDVFTDAWIRANLTVSTRYTLLATAHLNAPQTGTLHASARALFVHLNGTNIVTGAQAQAPNLGGTHPLRISFTTPSTLAGYNVIRLYNGAMQGGGDVWWDELMLIEGDYKGPYFDGTQPSRTRSNLALNPRQITGGSSAERGSRFGNVGAFVTQTWHPTLTTATRFTAQTDVAATGRNAVDFGQNSDVAVGGTDSKKYPVIPGAVITLTLSAYSSRGYPYALQARFHDGTNWVGVLTTGNSQIPNAATGTASWVVPTGAVYAVFRLTIETPDQKNAEWFEYTGIAIERYTTAPATTPSFFDGSTPATTKTKYGWEGTANASRSYLTDPDFTYAWVGTANASASERQAPRAASMSGVTGYNAHYQSRFWTSNRSRSMVIDNRHAPGVTYSEFTLSASYPGGVGAMKSKTFTAYATVHNEGTMSQATSSGARTISARMFGSTTLPEVMSVYPTGNTDVVSVTFTVPNDATSVAVRLHGLASTDTNADGRTWWDSLVIMEGDYDSEVYFDGSKADTSTGTTVGSIVEDYAWTGTADASTSTYRTGTIYATPDADAYNKAVEDLTRYMHTVTAVAGPTIVQKIHRGDAWGYVVEFVLVSAVPWLHGITRQLPPIPLTPTIIQDVPFNLVPYPSAELALGTVIAATNYSDNPSVELNTTNWVQSSSVVLAANVTGSQADKTAGGLASVGNKSFRTHFVATNAGTAGQIMAQNTTPNWTYVTGMRMSVNMWASPLLVSGTAVLGATQIIAIWRNGTTVTRSDVIGTVPAGGGALTSKSILLPTGTNNVIVRAVTNLTSWSTGATVDLYADAVAVTVP